MKKRLRIIVFLIIGLLLSGCSGSRLPSTPAEFDQVLAGQSEPTMKDFMDNFETAKKLLEKGAAPAGEMPVYVPFDYWHEHQTEDVNQGIRDGFYAVSLDPEIYGVSNFFVLPVGLRTMTAEEYLQLAQFTNLSAEELVLPENSWMTFQNRQENSSRALTEREQFWLKFQANEVIRQRDNGETRYDLPIGIYVGCGEQRKGFVLYPSGEMDAAALQEAGTIMRHLQTEEERALWLPTDNEFNWRQALTAAKDAVATETERSENPKKDYVKYDAEYDAEGNRTGRWTVALYYTDGRCFLVELDSIDGGIHSLEQLPDNFLDPNRTWALNEESPF